MSLFDSLRKNIFSSENNGISTNNAVEKTSSSNRTEVFTFNKLPTCITELQALPEASLTSPFATVALTLAVLCNFKNSPEKTFEMLDFLKGPEAVSGFEKQFIKEHLGNEVYKAFSYFDGTSPENNYTPSEPYRITVIENPYSFINENWATLYIRSSGADNPRPIKLRKKPSTGQWFLNEIQCLADIRKPVEDDPWA